MYTFLSIFLWKVCTIFTSVFGKTSEELWKKYAIIGIDIDIDPRESIDTYRYVPLSISIDTFPITSPFALGHKPLLFVIEPRNSSLNLRVMWQGISGISGGVELLLRFLVIGREGEITGIKYPDEIMRAVGLNWVSVAHNCKCHFTLCNFSRGKIAPKPRAIIVTKSSNFTTPKRTRFATLSHKFSAHGQLFSMLWRLHFYPYRPYFRHFRAPPLPPQAQ